MIDQEDDGLEKNFEQCCDKAAQRAADNAAQVLSEHYDSVRIICVSHQHGITGIYSTGRGNLYSQHGSVRDWIMRQDALLNKEMLKE